VGRGGTLLVLPSKGTGLRIPLAPRDVIEVWRVSPEGMLVEIFEGQPFAFEYGTDRAAYTNRVLIPDDDDYYLAIRVRIFSGKARIKIRIVRERSESARAPMIRE
jgi:hypothetical protein